MGQKWAIKEKFHSAFRMIFKNQGQIFSLLADVLRYDKKFFRLIDGLRSSCDAEFIKKVS